MSYIWLIFPVNVLRNIYHLWISGDIVGPRIFGSEYCFWHVLNRDIFGSWFSSFVQKFHGFQAPNGELLEHWCSRFWDGFSGLKWCCFAFLTIWTQIIVLQNQIMQFHIPNVLELERTPIFCLHPHNKAAWFWCFTVGVENLSWAVDSHSVKYRGYEWVPGCHR